MDIFTHGNQTCWNVEKMKKYNTDDASNLSNQGFTLITTIACYTNAFDSHSNGSNEEDFSNDPCLSEAFIRNPTSGVIGYLGASNKGIGSSQRDIKLGKYGPSFEYEKQFYNQLFSERKGFRNFAKIVSETKRKMASQITSSTSAYRWVHYCLNPIGDAEMPIYIYSPNKMNEPQITSLNNNISVNTEYPDCRITIAGTDASGKFFFGSALNKGEEVHFSKVNAQSLYLCLTRPDCQPLLYHGVRKSLGVYPGQYKYEFSLCTRYPFEENSILGARINGFNTIGDEATIVLEIDSAASDKSMTITSFDSFGNLTGTTGEISHDLDNRYSAKVKVSHDSNVIVLTSDGQILDSITVVN